MTIIYSVSTNEAHRIKVLMEMFCHTIKLACFELNEHGIFLRTTDNEDSLLIDLVLRRENFKKYKCTKTQYVGVNVIHLYKMLKCIKKKDAITMFIDDERPNDLAIRIEQFDQINRTTSFVKIQNVQNIEPGIPTGYGHPVIIPSGNFQKLVKGLNHIYEQVDITATGGWLRFLCDAGEVYSREVEIGELTPSEQTMLKEVDKRVKDGSELPTDWYHYTFHTYQLVQLIKISGLSSNIQAYVNQDLPLLFKLNVGSLGELSIYIKSIEQMVDEDEVEKNMGADIDNFNSDSD
jgi:proliferating cell nuclear antigen PCNA